MGRDYKKISLQVIEKILVISIYVIFGIVFINFFLRPIIGIDFWRHLKLGEIITKQKSLFFAQDPLLFTNSSERLLDNWFFQVIAYAFYRIGGWVSLSFFQLGIVILTYIFLLKMMKKITIPSLFFLLFSFPLLSSRLLLRPHLFSYLFIVIFIYFLWHRGLNKKRDFLFLIFLQIFWANTHIFFFFGPILVFIYLAEEVITRTCSTKRELQILLLIVLLCLVSLINPLGVRVWSNFINTFFGFMVENPMYVASSLDITELTSPFLYPHLLYRYTYIVTLTLSLLLVIPGIIFKKNIKYSFLFCFLMLFSFYSIRMSIPFMIIFPLFAIYNLRLFKPDYERLVKPIREAWGKILIHVFKIVILAFLLVSFAIIYRQQIIGFYRQVLIECRNKQPFSGFSNPILMTRLHITKGLVDFMNDNPMPDRIYNDYNSGSALTFYTGKKMFIDSRGCKADLMNDFKLLYYADSTPQEVFSLIIDKYKFQGFIVGISADCASEATLKKIFDDGRFSLVYADSIAALFLSNDFIDKNKSLQKDWGLWVDQQCKRIDEEILDKGQASYYCNIGKVFYIAGNMASADKLFKTALIIDPRSTRIYYNLALCALRENDYDSAYKYIYAAYKDYPNDLLQITLFYKIAHDLKKTYMEKTFASIIINGIDKEYIESFIRMYEYMHHLDLSSIRDYY